ncbi:MAG: pilus assembly PilX N-terminal domain-containing protein [Candidatus Rokubacteria bacterium]|nr:pilus assembly PilX N-terminal domain-containing protein [Candidatus Rokubacteria bacterium]
MNMWRKTMGNQRGIAAPLAMYTLVLLSVLMLAFVSMAAQEPQVSRNLVDMTQARYAADAGVEWAFDTLVATPNWSTILQTGGGSMVSNQTLPGLTAAFGTYTVVARNDTLAGDRVITGQATLDVAPGSATVDNNGILILTSTGTVNGVTRQIQVVVRRLQLPPFPGAVNEPGLQADTFNSTTNFQIDGRDYNRDGTFGPGSGLTNLKFGIATQPGVQANMAPTTFEQNAEAPFNTAEERARVIGKQDPNHALVDPAGPPGTRTGRDTIAWSNSLTPTNMNTFLNALAAFPMTNVLQSTMACPMVMSSSATANAPTLTNGCGVNKPINLGTTSAPTLTYFRGDLDTSSMFTGLKLQGGGTIQGAGILVVEDGDLSVNVSNLRWDGIVMVVGRYVGSGFRAGSNSTNYGAFVSMETIGNEAPGFYEFLNQAGSLTLRNSQQNIDMVQGMRALHRISSWREL